jgi:hypothetical protein
MPNTVLSTATTTLMTVMVEQRQPKVLVHNSYLSYQPRG